MSSAPSLRKVKKPTPFLRWAGGKQQLLPVLREHFPAQLSEKYHEPFVGAGSIFFSLAPKPARIADANSQLIQTYRWIRDRCAAVCEELEHLRARANHTDYYRIRDIFNSSKSSPAQAARFIFLNKTCFNGIFRVNKAGCFNVPYGWKEPPALPTPEELVAVSAVLAETEIVCETFLQSLSAPQREEFVYLDPPYPPLNGTAYFTHYTSECFSRAQQIRLATCFRRLDSRGVRLLMTNADIPLIRKLYYGFRIKTVPVVRYITCKAVRYKVGELIIKNYD